MNHPHDDLEQPEGEVEDTPPDYDGPCEVSEDGRHYIVHGDVCRLCTRIIKIDEEVDEEYERAAARARSNDFEETGGRDWT